jgi:CRISPR-associated helicase Cas3
MRITDHLDDIDDEVDADEICGFLAGLDGLPRAWARLLDAIAGCAPAIAFLDETDRSRGFVLFGRKVLPPAWSIAGAGVGDGADAVTEREDSSAIGVEVSLSDHLSHVEGHARRFAELAGLPPPLIELIAFAGRLHDLGKADPRFQADLRDSGSLASTDPDLAALLLPAGELLAKSARFGRAQRSTSQGTSAAPPGFRHEALSVPLAERHPRFLTLTAEERDLVLWLVGTHHGYGRPFFPPSDDPAPRTAIRVHMDGEDLAAEAREAPLRLDQGWFERAARLNRRYGPWELARLEAIVRLADHAASAEEQAQGEKRVIESSESRRPCERGQ